MRTASFRSRPQITYTSIRSRTAALRVHHSILPNAPLQKAVPAKNDVAQLPRCLAASTAAAASRAATKSSDRSWPVSGCAARSWVQFGSKLCFAGSVCQLSFRRVCLQESLVPGPSDACSDLLGRAVILRLFGTRCHPSSFAATATHSILHAPKSTSIHQAFEHPYAAQSKPQSRLANSGITQNRLVTFLQATKENG